MTRLAVIFFLSGLLTVPVLAQQGRGLANDDARNALGLGANEAPVGADFDPDDEEDPDPDLDENPAELPPPPPIPREQPKTQIPSGRVGQQAREPHALDPKTTKKNLVPTPGNGDAAAHAKPREPVEAEPESAGLEGLPLVVITPTADVSATFLELWEKRRQALRKHENLKAAAQMSAITQQFQKFGGDGAMQQSLSSIALALAREAETALEQNDILQAIALSESAALFAPTLPPVQFTLARVRFSRAPGDVASYVKAWRQGVQSYFVDLGSTLGFALSLMLLLGGVLLLTAMALSAAFALKVFKLAVHDIGHLLPRGVSTMQAGLLLALFAVLPMLLRLGPVFTGLWWLILAWPYLTGRERKVVFLSQVASMLFLLLVLAAGKLIGPASQEAITIYNSTRDLEIADPQQRLQDLLDQHPNDPLILAAKGWIAKRDGDLPAAKKFNQLALRQEPDWAWLHNNLGNVLALEGKFEPALSEYSRASQIAPTLFAAPFNTANLYFRYHKMAQGQSTSQTAKSVDAVAYDRFKAITDRASLRAYNRAVLDINIPASLIYQRMFAQDQDVSAFQNGLTGLVYAGLPLSLAAGLHLALLVLLIFAGVVVARFRPSHACPRCGRPACPRCSDGLPRNDVCAQCFHAFLAPAKDVDAALKVRKEIEVRRYQARRLNLYRLLSLVVAGLGHLFAGAPVRGALGVFTVAGLAASILFVGGLIPMPYMVQAAWPLGSLIGLGVAFVLVALLAFTSVSNLED